MATRHSVSDALAQELRKAGFPTVTAKMVEEIIIAWLSGKRGLELPHGILGPLVGKHLDELETEKPGALRKLR